MRGNLGNVKEKPTRKICYSREKKRLAPSLAPGSTLQNFARRHFFDINEVTIVFL